MNQADSTQPLCKSGSAPDVGLLAATTQSVEVMAYGPLRRRWTRTFIVLVAIALTSGDRAQGSDVHFLNPNSLSAVSPEPTSAKIADFTGDGRNDVLVIARDGVTLRIGSEHDAFAQAIETPIDQRFAVTRTADFTGDGILDLCLEGAPGTSRDLVSVMPGTGNGAFGAPIVSALSDYYTSSVAADFDGDGATDLVTLAGYRAPIQFLHGDGKGHFEPAISSPMETEVPESASAGDFDGDGRVDVAVVTKRPSDFKLDVLWNEGGGVFTATRHGTLESSRCMNAFLQVGDLNADGRADIVSCSEVRFGAAGRHFAVTSLPAMSVAGIADLDGNGFADIVATTHSTIKVITSTRTGGFSSPRLYLPGPDVGFATLGDIDTDGDIDLLFARRLYYPDELLWIAGNGDGTLRSNPAVYVCPDNLCHPTYDAFGSDLQVAVMDVNGDREPDFVAYDGSALIVTPSIGDGVWGAPTTTEADRGPYPNSHLTAAGDLDGDGHGDLVLTRFGGHPLVPMWTILLGRTDGTFDTGQTIGNVPRRPWLDLRPRIGIGDLSGDGVSDLIDAKGSIRIGSGRGTFGSPIATGIDRLNWIDPSDAGPEINLIDLNRDGKLDIADRESGIYMNKGALAFVALETGLPYPSYEEWRTSIFTDMTGDGIPDILDMEAADYEWIGSDWPDYLPTTQKVTVSRGIGDGTFIQEDNFDWPGPTARMPWFRGGVQTADFDGDGNMDVALGTDILFGDPISLIRSISSLDMDSGWPWWSFNFWDFRGYRVQWIGAARDAAPPSIVIGSLKWGIYAILPTVGADEPLIDTTILARRHPSRKTTVKVESSTGAIPRGTVRFESRGSVVGFAALDRFGTTVIPPSVETSDLIAVYLGNERFRASRTDSGRRSAVRH